MKKLIVATAAILMSTAANATDVSISGNYDVSVKTGGGQDQRLNQESNVNIGFFTLLENGDTLSMDYRLNSDDKSDSSLTYSTGDYGSVRVSSENEITYNAKTISLGDVSVSGNLTYGDGNVSPSGPGQPRGDRSRAGVSLGYKGGSLSARTDKLYKVGYKFEEYDLSHTVDRRSNGDKKTYSVTKGLTTGIRGYVSHERARSTGTTEVGIKVSF